MTIEDTSCCGVRELNGIGEQLACYTVSDIQREFFEKDEWGEVCNDFVPLLIFTDIYPYKSAKGLVSYIKKHSLGDVIVSRGRKNSNSGNFIKVFTWSVNKKNLKKLEI